MNNIDFTTIERLLACVLMFTSWWILHHTKLRPFWKFPWYAVLRWSAAIFGIFAVVITFDPRMVSIPEPYVIPIMLVLVEGMFIGVYMRMRKMDNFRKRLKNLGIDPDDHLENYGA